MPLGPKCPACGTRGTDQHEPNDEFCREMQYEREWKNREEHHEHDDLDVLA
jgi:hypothetical protein